MICPMTTAARPAEYVELQARENRPYVLGDNALDAVKSRWFYSRVDFAAKDVLDVGCGSADSCQYMADHGGRVTGVDLVADFIAYARRRHTTLNLQVMDAHDLHFPAASFDVVTVDNCLEHLHTPDKAFLEIARVLRPGGKLYGYLPFEAAYSGHCPSHLWRIGDTSPIKLACLKASLEMLHIELLDTRNTFSIEHPPYHTLVMFVAQRPTSAVRVAWIAAPTEADCTVAAACRNRSDLIVSCHSLPTIPPLASPLDSVNPIFSAGDVKWKNIHELIRHLFDEPANLIVMKFPFWLPGDLVGEAVRLSTNRPVVAWCSEQGPMRKAAMQSVIPWPRIAVNNMQDFHLYKRTFPGKKIFYMPFGCAPSEGCTVSRCDDNGEFDVLVDGVPHYVCSVCGGSWKRQSINTMVHPLLNQPYKVAIYGPKFGPHGWSNVPGVCNEYKGSFYPWDYPAIYAKTKLYLGISWNWNFGGFGCKLARALSTGVPVIFHRTVGMAEEGLANGVQLATSSTPEETKQLVDYYLTHDEERRRMGLRGQMWANAMWDWAMLLKKLADELSKA